MPSNVPSVKGAGKNPGRLVFFSSPTMPLFLVIDTENIRKISILVQNLHGIWYDYRTWFFCSCNATTMRYEQSNDASITFKWKRNMRTQTYPHSLYASIYIAYERNTNGSRQINLKLKLIERIKPLRLHTLVGGLTPSGKLC